jgi:hypothetical protein
MLLGDGRMVKIAHPDCASAWGQDADRRVKGSIIMPIGALRDRLLSDSRGQTSALTHTFRLHVYFSGFATHNSGTFVEMTRLLVGAGFVAPCHSHRICGSTPRARVAL